MPAAASSCALRTLSMPFLARSIKISTFRASGRSASPPRVRGATPRENAASSLTSMSLLRSRSARPAMRASVWRSQENWGPRAWRRPLQSCPGTPPLSAIPACQPQPGSGELLSSMAMAMAPAHSYSETVWMTLVAFPKPVSRPATIVREETPAIADNIEVLRHRYRNQISGGDPSNWRSMGIDPSFWQSSPIPDRGVGPLGSFKPNCMPAHAPSSA